MRNIFALAANGAVAIYKRRVARFFSSSHHQPTTLVTPYKVMDDVLPFVLETHSRG